MYLALATITELLQQMAPAIGSGSVIAVAVICIFLLLVSTLYYIFPAKARGVFLLIISYLFYCIEAQTFALFLLLSTILTFYLGKCIAGTESKSKRRWALYTTLALNFGLLFLLKFQTNFQLISFPRMYLIALPVGMSFYMFRATGYVMDLYNKTLLKSEDNFVSYALFVSFFPAILAGPIQKASDLIPQINNPAKFSRKSIELGIRGIVTGLFLKLVIADNLSVNFAPFDLFSSEISTGQAWFATLIYPIRLYTDFLGYSLIAIGAANLLGFNIEDNFDKPFLAENIPAFWRKWHISLTNWMNDYVFSPLSILLRGWNIWGIAIASGFIFILVGIWHGGTANYIIFGGIHALAVSISILCQKSRKRFEKKHGLKENKIYCLLRMLATYLIVSFSFIFFRSIDLSSSLQTIQALFGGASGIPWEWNRQVTAAALATAILFIYEIKDTYFPNSVKLLNSDKIYIRIIVYCMLFAATILWGSDRFLDFIYFKF